MTHTLHRAGKYDDVKDDFIVSVMPAKGFNDDNSVEMQKAFLRVALKHNPVNLGDSTKGSEYRPSKNLRPTVHWHRESSPDPDRVVKDVDGPTTASAVFDNFESVKNVVAELRELDLGISVNIASVPSRAVECCDECGIVRHSVEYSLGFQGSTERLPDDDTLQVSSMCGHGMVAANFVRKMQDWVRSGRRTPEEASRYLARFCVCGSFNPARARRILERAAVGK